MLVIDSAVVVSKNEHNYGDNLEVVVIAAEVNRYMRVDQTLKSKIAEAVKAWLKTYSGKAYVLAQYGYMPEKPGISIQQVREVLGYTHPEYTSPPLSRSLEDVGIKALAFYTIDADLDAISWNADENLADVD